MVEEIIKGVYYTLNFKDFKNKMREIYGADPKSELELRMNKLDVYQIEDSSVMVNKIGGNPRILIKGTNLNKIKSLLERKTGMGLILNLPRNLN